MFVCLSFYRQVGFYSKMIWGSEEMGVFIVKQAEL